MEEEQKPEPKISLPEVILISIALGVIEIVAAFFPVAGPWIANIIAGPLLDFYLYIKGIPLTRALVSQLVKFVPIINELPILLGGFLFTVYLDHNPKLEAVVGKAAALTGKAGVKGAVGGEVAATKGVVAAERAGVTAATRTETAVAGAAGVEEAAARGVPSAAQPEKVEAETGRKPSEKPRRAAAETEEGTGATEEAQPPKPEIPGEALGEMPTPEEEVGKLFQKPPPFEKPEEEENEEPPAAA